MFSKRQQIGSARGMTLIELILVMAVLATVLAIAAPSLSRFFSGRDLKEEVRRFVALTKFARSEAVSRGVMMELWIDPDQRAYGLRPQGAANSEENRARVYQLADSLTFDVETETLDSLGRAVILFWPDGSIDEQSVETIRIQENEESIVEIVQTEFGLGYEVHNAEEKSLAMSRQSAGR